MPEATHTDDSTLNHAADIVFGKIIQQVNQKMGSGIEREQILDFIFDSLNFVIPFDRIGIAILEQNNKVARLAWVQSKKQVSILEKNYYANLEGSSLGNIIKTGEPRIINDLRSYHALHPASESTALALKDGILSNLTCLLRANNVPIGFVFFSSFQSHTYENQHLRTFLAIADELSVVVEQARLKNYFNMSESRERTLSRVVHDLRSPVSTIKTCLNFAAEEEWFKQLPSAATEIYKMLNKTAQDMFLLLEEMLELRRIRDKTNRLDLHTVNLINFINDVVETGGVLGRAKQIAFDWVVRFDLPQEVEFDTTQVRRVLDNLISNAIKFSTRGSKIKFDVRGEDLKLVFSVEDQGKGIAEKDMGLLFTEFGRTSTSPTEGESSTGLGLAIAKDIVEKHGGQISVKRHLGEGSTFTFWIPLVVKTPLH
jgi:signal transduction histidine kinase